MEYIIEALHAKQTSENEMRMRMLNSRGRHSNKLSVNGSKRSDAFNGILLDSDQIRKKNPEEQHFWRNIRSVQRLGCQLLANLKSD